MNCEIIPQEIQIIIDIGGLTFIGCSIIACIVAISLIFVSEFCLTELQPLIIFGLSNLLTYAQTYSIVLLNNEGLKTIRQSYVRWHHIFNFEIAEIFTQEQKWYYANGGLLIKFGILFFGVIVWITPLCIIYLCRERVRKSTSFYNVTLTIKKYLFIISYIVLYIPILNSAFDQLIKPAQKIYTLPGLIIVYCLSILALFFLMIFIPLVLWREIYMNQSYQKQFHKSIPRTRAIDTDNIEEISYRRSFLRRQTIKEWALKFHRMLKNTLFFPISEGFEVFIDKCFTPLYNKICNIFAKKHYSTKEDHYYKNIYSFIQAIYSPGLALREIDFVIIRKDIWIVIAVCTARFKLVHLILLITIHTYWTLWYIIHSPHNNVWKNLSISATEVILLIQLCLMLDLVINQNHYILFVVIIVLSIFIPWLTIMMMFENVIRIVIEKIKKNRLGYESTDISQIDSTCKQ